MTVYVLTSGCYSDYHIHNVTLDKDIAEKYIKLYPDCEIEEYEPLEEREILNETVQHYYTCLVDWNNLEGYFGIFYSREDFEWGKENVTKVGKLEINIAKNPYLVFNIPMRQNEIADEEAMARLKKVVQDTMTQVKSLIELEGWTWEMIAENFNGKAVDCIATRK